MELRVGELGRVWGSFTSHPVLLTTCNSLDTSQPYVRGKVADYLNALIDLGAAGFRVDAASRMSRSWLLLQATLTMISTVIEPREMAQIYGLLKKKVYISQEAPGAPNYLDIAKNGDNQEFVSFLPSRVFSL